MTFTEEQKKHRRRIQGAYKRGPEYALDYCREHELACRPVIDEFGPAGSLALRIEGIGVLEAGGKWARDESKYRG